MTMHQGVPISTYLRAQQSQNTTLSAALGPTPFQPHHHDTTPQASTSHVGELADVLVDDLHVCTVGNNILVPSPSARLPRVICKYT